MKTKTTSLAILAATIFLLAAGHAHELDGHAFLLTSTRTGYTEIFLVDPVSGDAKNLTRSAKSEERYPCWSPDGKRAAFTSDRDGTMNLYTMNADGSDVKQFTHLKAPAEAYMPSWGGDRIVFGWHAEKPEMASIRDDGGDLKMLGAGHDPCVSPDGMRIAYTGECVGGVSVFTMNANGSGKKQIVPEVNPWGAIFSRAVTVRKAPRLCLLGRRSAGDLLLQRQRHRHPPGHAPR